MYFFTNVQIYSAQKNNTNSRVSADQCRHPFWSILHSQAHRLWLPVPTIWPSPSPNGASDTSQHRHKISTLCQLYPAIVMGHEKCPHVSHHPTIRYMVYNGYYKVMSNIPKMGHLPTPDCCHKISAFQEIGAKRSRTHHYRKVQRDDRMAHDDRMMLPSPLSPKLPARTSWWFHWRKYFGGVSCRK